MPGLAPGLHDDGLENNEFHRAILQRLSRGEQQGVVVGVLDEAADNRVAEVAHREGLAGPGTTGLLRFGHGRERKQERRA
ncbi:hypothetical protein Q664_32815 [Archangium violaceum Cb vi76]|uniref:Uncharacterized protein n=1 Tax=Archangium violaceum Cb vi76 TaxID=1406225 RepID=A0A084SMJ5_9BACT|nr:hypothetical protein Q664_32815 [Archangium violaceum Cb vi76]